MGKSDTRVDIETLTHTHTYGIARGAWWCACVSLSLRNEIFHTRVCVDSFLLVLLRVTLRPSKRDIKKKKKTGRNYPGKISYTLLYFTF